MMSVFSTRTGLLSIATALMLVLNGILLIKDYKSKNELANLKMEATNLRSRLYDAAIQIRIYESNAIFGSTFVPRFNIEDLQGNMIDLPYFGSQDMLILFFNSSDCRLCLENLGLIKARVSSVPIVGVALKGTISEMIQIKQEFKYDFPVFIAIDPSFHVTQSPRSVLIDRNRNILNIAKIEPRKEEVEEVIKQISTIIERR